MTDSVSNRHGSQGEEPSMSNGSGRSSCNEGVDPSKLSSSQHSSVKSLVEEKDNPSIQQAEAIEIEIDKQKRTTTPPLTQEDNPMDGEGENENMEVELEAISKASQSYLQKHSSSADPTSTSAAAPVANKLVENYVQDSGMQLASVKGLNSVISDISPEPTNGDKGPETKTDQLLANTESDSQQTTQNKAQGIDLSFLDDLEAQVMDVLDDTNTFDPSKIAPPPEPPKPAKKPELKVQPSPPKRKYSDETDSVFSPKMSPSHSKTLPNRRFNKDLSPFEVRSRVSSESSSEHCSPTHRRNTVGSSPARRKAAK